MALQLQIQNRFRGGRAVGNDYVIVRVDGGRSQIVARFGGNEAVAREVLALAVAS
jgi:hypothetical protein